MGGRGFIADAPSRLTGCAALTGTAEMLVVWARPEPVGVDEGAETERQTAEEVPRDALLLEVRQMREKSLKLKGKMSPGVRVE